MQNAVASMKKMINKDVSSGEMASVLPSQRQPLPVSFALPLKENSFQGMGVKSQRKPSMAAGVRTAIRVKFPPPKSSGAIFEYPLAPVLCFSVPLVQKSQEGSCSSTSSSSSSSDPRS